MNIFEIICLVIYLSFAFSYMSHSFINDKDRDIVKIILIILAATLGIFLFPLIFAEDIYNFLNKENRNY